MFITNVAVPFSAATIILIINTLGPATASLGASRTVRFHPSSSPVEGSYIVRYRSNVSEDDLDLAIASLRRRARLKSCPRVRSGVEQCAGRGIRVGGLNLITVTMDRADVDRLLEDENVEYVEENSVVTPDTVSCELNGNPPWGLDMVDSNDGVAARDGFFNTLSNGGSGATAYVIDTGISSGLSQFGGRVSTLYRCGGCGDDGDSTGHGTHVAGTIASSSHGIARGVAVKSLKVIPSSGSGTVGDVINAIATALEDAKANGDVHKSVINISLGSSKSTALNELIKETVLQNLTIVVSAGNDYSDACAKSPASAPEAITVGSMSECGSRSSFSNFGSCVDIFAPGGYIESLSVSGEGKVLSGTSMATPHVTGVVAYFLSQQTEATPTTALKWLRQVGAHGAVSGTCGSANLLVQLPCDNTMWDPSSQEVGVEVSEGSDCETCYEKKETKKKGAKYKSSAKCFDGESLVISRERGEVRISTLDVGEEVLSLSERVFLPFYDVVYLISHSRQKPSKHQAAVGGELIEILLENGSRVRVTRGHVLILADGSRIAAERVWPGHNLMSVREGCLTSFQKLGPTDNTSSTDDVFGEANCLPHHELVVNVSTKPVGSLYSPLTRSGTLIVDGGVAASVYNAVVDDLAERVVHALLWPLRLASHYHRLPGVLSNPCEHGMRSERPSVLQFISHLYHFGKHWKHFKENNG